MQKKIYRHWKLWEHTGAASLNTDQGAKAHLSIGPGIYIMYIWDIYYLYIVMKYICMQQNSEHSKKKIKITGYLIIKRK